MSRGWWASPMPVFGKVKKGYAETQVFSIYRRRWQFRIRNIGDGWTAERWGCNYEPHSLETYVVTATGERVGDPVWATAKAAQAACFTTCLREGFRGQFEPLASDKQARFATFKEGKVLTRGVVVHDPNIPDKPCLDAVKLGYDIMDVSGERWDTGYEDSVDKWEEELEALQDSFVASMRTQGLNLHLAPQSPELTPEDPIATIVFLSTTGAIDQRDAARSLRLIQDMQAMKNEDK